MLIYRRSYQNHGDDPEVGQLVITMQERNLLNNWQKGGGTVGVLQAMLQMGQTAAQEGWKHTLTDLWIRMERKSSMAGGRR